MRRGAICIHGPHTYKQGRVCWDVKVEDSLGCSDHEVVDFRILKGGSRANSKVTVLDFRRAVVAASWICFEESYGIWLWREEGSKKENMVSIDRSLPLTSGTVNPKSRRSGKSARRPS